MGKTGGRELLRSTKGIDREPIRRDYIMSDEETVKSFMLKMFTPSVANSWTVIERTKGRRQDKIDYWEDYYRNFKISPEVKRQYTLKLNRFAKVQTDYLGALIEYMEDKLERDDKGKLKNPNGISLSEYITLSNIILPLLNKTDGEDENGKKAIDYLGAIKQALARTNATRDNNKQK